MSAVLKFDDNVFNLPRRGGGGSDVNSHIMSIAAMACIIAADNRERDGTADFLHRFIECFMVMKGFPHGEFKRMTEHVRSVLIEFAEEHGQPEPAHD